MDDFDEQLHRTWVQLLVDRNHREVAAIAVDSYVGIRYRHYVPEAIIFEIPTSAYIYVKESPRIKQIMEQAIKYISQGRIFDYNGQPCDDLPFTYHVKLVKPEEGWQNVVRNLIANIQDPNQGIVTEKVFHRKGKEVLTYNEMKFGSQAEIRIAQELESRKVLFFPLPLAVRAETGNFYQDHREPDFLICHEGVWGILEVSRHSDRYEKDAEKVAWFEKSGILCVKHYTAERCYKNSAEVVDEFLGILKLHKR